LPHSIIGNRPILNPGLIFGRGGARVELRRIVLSRVVREQSPKRVFRRTRRSVFVPLLKKLARWAAAATKLLLEYRFECGKRARRTPQRVRGVSRHNIARRLADADQGAD
jgi:hypothetical protein